MASKRRKGAKGRQDETQGGRINRLRSPAAGASVHSLLEGYAHILRRARAAPKVVLFLDFDGTLTPLRSLGNQARLAPETRDLLDRLSHCPRLAVFILSGRRLSDLASRVRVPKVRCLGVHGWEGRSGVRLDSTSRLAVRRARAAARRDLLQFSGIRLEDKRVAFAIHYRGAPPVSVRQARRRLLSLLRPFHHELRLMDGKRIWEVLPQANRGKGEAAQQLLRRYPPRSLPIYIGDDTTDEAAFCALPRAVTVRVGGFRGTHARWRARNPTEVLYFLKLLETDPC